jgi:hypothetical protein
VAKGHPGWLVSFDKADAIQNAEYFTNREPGLVTRIWAFPGQQVIETAYKRAPSDLWPVLKDEQGRPTQFWAFAVCCGIDLSKVREAHINGRQAIAIEMTREELVALEKDPRSGYRHPKMPSQFHSEPKP